ncbi:MAG TPA: thrombospondin type 3 repeat-containing protein, partial [Candidatus Tumulicola sp.]|nr:thrombospondin type 3 repeat-containing protein [Candidatus Tumulicola sp.]
IRNLDNSLTSLQAAGRAFYFNSNASGAEIPVDRQHSCGGCHVLDPNGNRGQTAHPGFFGTDGRLSFDNESQILKVPHLRNAYQKLGMYGASLDAVRALASIIPQLNPPVNAVRGFGYNHDGVLGTIEQFASQEAFVLNTSGTVPNPGGIPFFNNPANPFDSSSGLSSQGAATRRSLAAFLLAYDSNLAPIVGQQLTLTRDNAAASADRLALLIAQATAGACDLVVHGNVFGRDTGFVFQDGAFQSDGCSKKALSSADLVALASRDGKVALTFTAVPPGSGWRLGIDRDSDGFGDSDEASAGTDPADPSSTP